ncbi:hypothetical protein ALC62_11497 [Cyphomyrmex costatus]|uniref:Uncharacterized protein n=1 Tax=Cyphomyrmex costatus TaxID=456900 RepID=A0A151ICJ5_9HYME|nr:hypothetical protein ALC62_11497 [Cyphomyrmex costatus]
MLFLSLSLFSLVLCLKPNNLRKYNSCNKFILQFFNFLISTNSEFLYRDRLISVPVYVEDSGEMVILKLLPQDAAKATKDINYMTSLITNVYKKRNKNFINQESVQISIDKSNEIDSSLMSSSNLSCTTSLEEQEFVDDPKKQEFDDPKDQTNDKSLFIWPSACICCLINMKNRKEPLQNERRTANCRGRWPR